MNRARFAVATVFLAAAVPAWGGPTIAGFTPDHGPVGTLVKIVGDGLGGVREIRFGDAAAQVYWVATDTHLKAYVPPGATSAPIQVVTEEGEAASARLFAVTGSGPLATALLPPRPNPARSPVAVGFTLSSPGRARLTVHDLAGRVIRVLADETLPAGEHRRHWDLTDGGGRSAPPGIYLARLSAGRFLFSRRLLILR